MNKNKYNLSSNFKLLNVEFKELNISDFKEIIFKIQIYIFKNLNFKIFKI